MKKKKKKSNLVLALHLLFAGSAYAFSFVLNRRCLHNLNNLSKIANPPQTFSSMHNNQFKGMYCSLQYKFLTQNLIQLCET